jgi:hypothetical protein
MKLRSASTVLFLLGICNPSGWAIERVAYMEYIPEVATTFSPQTRTHCLGRYLIDLPEDMGMPRLSHATLYFGLGSDFKTVEVQMPRQEEDIDRATFEKMVTIRRDELKNSFNAAVGVTLLLAE